MKRRGLGFIVGFLFCLPGCFAHLGGLVGKKDMAKVDVEGLSKRSFYVMTLMQEASISYSDAIISIEEANGKKEEAEKLKQLVAKLKAKPSKEDNKVLIQEENKAVADIEKNNDIGKINAAEGKKFMGEAIVSVGIGILLDGTAATEGAVLLKEGKSALTRVPSTTVSRVKDAFDVATLATEEIPRQAKNMKSFSGKLVDRFNEIPFLSAAEIAKKAKEVEKE